MLNISLYSNRNYHSKMLREISEQLSLDIRLVHYQCVKESAQHLDDCPDLADIIHMDIMAGSNIDAIRELRQRGFKGEIIFIADNADYVYDAFDVGPMQYIIRDETTYDRYASIFLNAAWKATKSKCERLIYRTKNKLIVFPLREIIYLTLSQRTITIKSEQGDFNFSFGFKEIEDQLQGQGFIRVHRSFWVNVYHVARIERKRLLLTSGDLIPVGGTYLTDIQKVVSLLKNKSAPS